ncbi:uncharacterized protein LOC133043265 [Dama dama]|uniref:uncharacterized protein LOC133043265 n=1 Tax=Dama dama TaxID=30532 RepID=UPI002A36FEEC|nr:uncharacterized protein LOC133043265 [Dama dama]
MFGQMQNTEESMMQKPRKHPYHCQRTWTCKDNPKCPKWHQTALKLTSVAMVTLVATVIGLTIWGFLTEQYTRWNLLLDWIEHFSSTKDVDLAGWHPIKSTIVTSEMSFARKYFCDYSPLKAKL